jgi:hypothetical protein
MSAFSQRRRLLPSLVFLFEDYGLGRRYFPECFRTPILGAIKMSTQEFRFFYLRNKNNFPIACLAYNISFDTRVVLYGLSTYNLRDELVYDQHMGRCLAVGHAMLDKNTITLPKGMVKLHDILWMLMSHLHKDKTLPTRARKAINAWLNHSIEQEIYNLVVESPRYYDASNGAAHSNTDDFDKRDAI